jgi:hypothetical protein
VLLINYASQSPHQGTGIHILLEAVILPEINMQIFAPYLLHELF